MEVIRPLLQPGTRLGVVAMAVVDRGDGAVDMVQDTILHDPRAAKLRQPGGDRAAEIMDRPMDFYRILRRLVALASVSGPTSPRMISRSAPSCER